MKPMVAPTAGLATPRVEKFVKENLIPYMQGELKEFFLCDPATDMCTTADRKEAWWEANWGVRVICFSFASDTVHELNKTSGSISVNEATAEARPDGKMEVTFWLSGRVARA